MMIDEMYKNESTHTNTHMEKHTWENSLDSHH